MLGRLRVNELLLWPPPPTPPSLTCPPQPHLPSPHTCLSSPHQAAAVLKTRCLAALRRVLAVVLIQYQPVEPLKGAKVWGVYLGLVVSWTCLTVHVVLAGPAAPVWALAS